VFVPKRISVQQLHHRLTDRQTDHATMSSVAIAGNRLCF